MYKAVVISFVLSLSGLDIFAQGMLPTANDSSFNISVELKLYPNPTLDFINIQVTNFKKGTYYEFRNIIGKKLIAGSLEKEVTTLDIEQFHKGIYLVSIFDQSGKRLITKKVLKK